MSRALLVPSVAAGASVCAAALLAAYAGAIAVNLVRGRRHVACGCLGPAAEQPLHAGLLLRNGVLVALAGIAALAPSGRGLSALDAFTIGAAIATVTLIYMATDGLLANRGLRSPSALDSQERGELLT